MRVLKAAVVLRCLHHPRLIFSYRVSPVGGSCSRHCYREKLTVALAARTTRPPYGEQSWANCQVMDAGGRHSPLQRRGRYGGWIRTRSLLGMSTSPQDALNSSSDVEQQLEATDADDADALGSMTSEGQDDEKATTSGIGWVAVATVLVTQVSFIGLSCWAAGPLIREQVASSFTFTFQDAGIGLLGSVPLLAVGFAFEKQDWEWIKKIDDITMQVTVQLLGTERQVSKVLALVIPLAVLIGFSEEVTFRGFVPLILAAKTGLPFAAVVALSGALFGVLHAATVAYFVNATVCGILFHCMLLSTGNIFVPIVAHAFYDAFALTRAHLKVKSKDVT